MSLFILFSICATYCTLSGALCPEEDLVIIEDHQLCPDCAEDLTLTCQRCGEYLLRIDNAGLESLPLCDACYERHYTACAHCECLLANSEAYYTDDDEDEPLCYECYQDRQENRNIHEYSYKPDPIFFGIGPLFMGVELEIDEGGKDGEYANQLLEIANLRDEHLYIKGDSSLHDGLELVTHPMSLQYHLQQMRWESTLAKARELAYHSHMTDTCGLHIHVNRSFFGESEAQQEDAIGRVLYFIEHHWAELLRFSRRTEYQLKKWAERYGYKERPKDILDTAKRHHGDRYTCVNLTNDATIEFRIFRGTLKYNTLAATLQLVSEICRVAVSLSDQDLSSLSWSSFVEALEASSLPELIQYLKERRLYVNEPIEMEEEL